MNPPIGQLQTSCLECGTLRPYGHPCPVCTCSTCGVDRRECECIPAQGLADTALGLAMLLLFLVIGVGAMAVAEEPITRAQHQAGLVSMERP